MSVLQSSMCVGRMAPAGAAAAGVQVDLTSAGAPACATFALAPALAFGTCRTVLCALARAGLAVAAIALVPPVAADVLPPFAAQAELGLAQAGEGLQRVALPLAVLQRLRTADRRDLRVLNAAGEAVPMAWAGEPPAPPASAPPGVALPLFVWPEGPAQSGDAEVQVEVTAGGAVVKVQRRGGPVKPPAAGGAASVAVAPGARAWLLDLGPLGGTDGTGQRGVKGQTGETRTTGPTARTQGSRRTGAAEASATPGPAPLAALVLQWATPPGGLVRRVQILASSDARQWVPAGEGTLIDLPAADGGAPVRQQRLEHFAPTVPGAPVESVGSAAPVGSATPAAPAPAAADASPVRYLRLQFDEPIALTRAEGIARAAAPGPALELARFKPLRSGPRTWTLDTGAALPVARLQLHLPQDNAVWPLALAWRPDGSATPAAPSGAPAAGPGRGAAAEDWQPLPGLTAYRLQRNGQRLEAPPLALAPVPARHWRFTLDERIAAPESGPELSLAWVAPQLLFAARGAGPFHLVFGAEQAPAVALERAALIPGYRPGDEFGLPQARLGAVVERPVAAPGWIDRLRASLAGSPRQWVLWAALAGAVALLAGLAWRLARDLGRPAPDA